MRILRVALDAFNPDNGYYPKDSDGLVGLVKAPTDAQKWRGPYLSSVPVDPWSNDYYYTYPGKGNGIGKAYDLMSTGPDGRGGTADDIGSAE